MKELFLRVTLLAALAMALPGCDRIINPILDEIVPGWRDEPAAVRPDSVRGDTTFYSYTFRATDAAVWPVGGVEGPTVVAVSEERGWFLPDFPPAPYCESCETYDHPVLNRIRLICRDLPDTPEPEVRERARALIAKAGMAILHDFASDTPSPSDSVVHPGKAFFVVYHPEIGLQYRTPASIPFMRRLRALDDTTLFEHVAPQGDFTIMPM